MQEPGLITIERVVAFVLTPVVVAASGTLSAYALKWGFNVTPAEVEAGFATGGLTAGAAAWKWLHGRQLSEQAKHALSRVEAETGPVGSDFIHTTLHDLEGLAQSAAEKAAAAIRTAAPGGKQAAPSSSTVQVAEGTGSPPEPPIPAAADPAPSGGPAPTDAAPVAEQADAGAATGQ